MRAERKDAKYNPTEAELASHRKLERRLRFKLKAYLHGPVQSGVAFSMFDERCFQCKEPIRAGDRFTTIMGHHVHERHAKCTHCDKQLKAPPDTYIWGDELTCWENVVHRRGRQCAVCGGGLADPMVITKVGEVSCAHHHRNAKVQCFSCGRPAEQPGTRPFTPNASKSRWVCAMCNKTAISTDEAAERLKTEILTAMASLGLVLEPAQVPLQLVDQLPFSTSTVHTEGMTHKTIERHGPLNATYRVESVSILDGLPRMHAGKVLAHEFMHAWLHLKLHADDLPPLIEEGLCDMIAYIWLSSQTVADNPHRAEAYGWLQQFDSDQSDSVYNRGRRMCQAALQGRSLHDLLNHIQQFGRLPSLMPAGMAAPPKITHAGKKPKQT